MVMKAEPQTELEPVLEPSSLLEPVSEPEPTTPEAKPARVPKAVKESDKTSAAPEPAPEKAPSERTYSQKEWSDLQSAKDRELAQYRQATIQMAQRMQAERAKAEEDVAHARDMRAVEDGSLTESDAEQRQRIRAEKAQGLREVAALRSQQQQIMADGEEYTRITVAHALGKMFEVDPSILINDKSLTSGELMEQKAYGLREGKYKARLTDLEKREAALAAKQEPPEKFDDNLASSGGRGKSDEQVLREMYPTMT